MFIDAFGIGGYRSFGDTFQMIGPFAKINLFMGPNNAGKSNLLSFLVHHYGHLSRLAKGSRQQPQFGPLDLPQGIKSSHLRVSFGLRLDGDRIQKFIEDIKPNLQRHGLDPRHVENIFGSHTLAQGTECAWFSYIKVGNEFKLSPDLVKGILAEKVLDNRQWSQIWTVLTAHSGGGLEQHWVPDILGRLSSAIPDPPAIDLVPAIRKVGEAGTVAQDHSGGGLIDRLAELQHPSLQEMALKERFVEINDFLKLVVGDHTAELEIPNKRDMILVHMGKKSLPLGSLGTGIHEVVILAAAATVLRGQVLCIEEPELHLHPILQKKLIRYLQEKTENQYFITTHSASFLDTPGAAIFQVGLENGESMVVRALTDKAKSSLCADLGYRASDLLQSNCVVWVEGPSDRIYLSYWIHEVAPDLVEGVHFSIMFYGGRLLSHLTAEDPDVTDFISLRRLNRNIAVVMDSDRDSEKSEINKTKSRVKEEFDKGPGFAWITEGREIENYIELPVLENALKSLKADIMGVAGKSAYKHAWHYRGSDGKVRDDVDKVKLAHEIVSRAPSLDVLDLRVQIGKLAGFIRRANGE